MGSPEVRQSGVVGFTMTAAQAASVAALAKLYMSTERVIVAEVPDTRGWVAVRTDKWRWLLREDGRVVAEGAPDA